MKLKRVLCIILVMLTALTGCSKPTSDDEPLPNTPPQPQSVTVEDSDGRTVTTSDSNGDIISVGYEATSLLIALGARGRITGAEAQSDETPLIATAYPEITKLPAVTDKDGGILIDKITEQNAGLVILTNDYAQYVSELEQYGLTVAVVRFETVKQIKESIELIGKLSNTEETARNLSNFYDSALTRLKAMTLTEEKKTVTLYNDDEILRDLLSYLNCDIVPNGEYVIAKAGSGAPSGAITAPSAVEPWDEPSVSLILGLYWYAYELFPRALSRDEVSQKAIDFYSEFYGIKYTAEELGIEQE